MVAHRAVMARDFGVPGAAGIAIRAITAGGRVVGVANGVVEVF